MIDKLEDLRTLGELEKLKKEDLIKIVRKATQLVKSEDIRQENADAIAKGFPLFAVGADANNMYVIKFDPNTKEARVTDIKHDPRGPHMNLYYAKEFLDDKIYKQTFGGNK